MGTGRAARSRANASKFGRGSVLDRIHHLFVQKLQHALAELLEDSQTRNGLPPSSVGLQHNMPKLRCFFTGSPYSVKISGTDDSTEESVFLRQCRKWLLSY